MRCWHEGVANLKERPGENHVNIEHLHRPCQDHDVRDLTSLLIDTVDSGAAVSFMQPLAADVAEAWWRSTLASPHPRAVFLVARDSEGIVGTVQLQPAWAPNQPHRAELCKLMVHRRARGRGLGRALMEAAEAAAREAGFALLTLDCKRGGVAEQLYEKMGWTRVGVIPDFARDADDKAWHDTVIFYKKVR